MSESVVSRGPLYELWLDGAYVILFFHLKDVKKFAYNVNKKIIVLWKQLTESWSLYIIGDCEGNFEIIN